MSTLTLSYRIHSEGQIALEHALFCLECELIFAGTASCPRCAGKAVWPLAEWVHPARPGMTVSKLEDSLADVSHSERSAGPSGDYLRATPAVEETPLAGGSTGVCAQRPVLTIVRGAGGRMDRTAS